MDPTVLELLREYGWLGVAFGSFLEGETVLISAAALANRGLLDPFAVWLAAAVGSWFSHFLFFTLGRVFSGQRILAWFPRWGPGIGRMDALIRRRSLTAVIALQYMYGMRRIGAVAIGLSSVSAPYFLIGEAINCMVWAIGIGTIGYLVGESAAQLDASVFGGVWLAIVTILAVTFLLRRLYRRARERTATPAGPTGDGE
ncbi:MAG: DedA family protein [Gemmatimonadota bacterium]